MIGIELSPATEAALRSLAARRGLSVEVIARELIESAPEIAGASPPAAVVVPRHGQDRESWLRDFRIWIASMKSHNPDFDDSRESIYEGRC